MKKMNKTEEYNKLRQIAMDNGLNQYDAAAHAMEMVLHPTLAKSMILDRDCQGIPNIDELELAKEAFRRR